MKARVSRLEKTFQPIELTITIENENDLVWYQELFNLTKLHLVECDPIFRKLQDPDPNGDLNDMLIKAEAENAESKL
jgi:hypothetical protein